jgi:hypothetical protein
MGKYEALASLDATIEPQDSLNNPLWYLKEMLAVDIDAMPKDVIPVFIERFGWTLGEGST